MNDPSKLFKILAEYQGQNIDEKTPAKYAAENFKIIFNINPYEYKELLKTAELIKSNSLNKKQDLNTFIEGLALSKPYSINSYLTNIASTADRPYTDISKTINSWLEQEFKQNHPDLFQKLDSLQYKNTKTAFNIHNSKNPLEIQQIVQKTNACINDDPFIFFNQITQDAGTIYLLAIKRAQESEFKDMPRGKPELGYVRLNAFQYEDKSKTALSVDNIWINNNNRQLICTLIDSLVNMANHLDIPIIDKTMSRNYLRQNNQALDIFEQEQDLFKLGHVPQITRYNHLWMPKDNDGFYLIKNRIDCQ